MYMYFVSISTVYMTPIVEIIVDNIVNSSFVPI